MGITKCHPEKKHYAFGLCKNCYNRKRYDPVKWGVVRRRYLLKSRFGLHEQDYALLVQKQDGVCAICKRPVHSNRRGPNGKVKHLAVDHNHITGNVRGLLCTLCNGMLGWFERYKDSVVVYLKV